MSNIRRPAFHFTPPSGWTNDPNGTVYYDGEYHLFYQHHPDSLQWGPMHWGHAVSPDLLHWEHLPIALYPDELGYIFSGSAVIDERNTSGLGTPGRPPLVVLFTHHGEGEKQSVAYSLDHGRTFIKYPGNPVLTDADDENFRDPKVFWHDATRSWVMVISYDEKLRIYRSANLLSWKLASELGPIASLGPVVLECPDLFELPFGGTTRWVLTFSVAELTPGGTHTVRYFTGAFDGYTFAPDSEPALADAGWDFYAAVTYSHVPGRTVWLGWMAEPAYAGAVPAEVWNGRMTLPRELTLAQIGGKAALCQMPAQEFMALPRKTIFSRRDMRLSPGEPVQTGDCGEAYVVEGLLSRGGAALEIELFGCVSLEIDPASGSAVLKRLAEGSVFRHGAFLGERRAALPGGDADVDFLIAVDGNATEIYLQGGALVFSALAFPENGRDGIAVTAHGECALKRLEIHRL